MKNKILKKIFLDELFKGSFILLMMMGIFNFLNWIFHFSMARLLGPSGYGSMAALISLTYIYGIPKETIVFFISKYVPIYNIRREKKKIKTLAIKSLKLGFKVSLILFLIMMPISFFLSDFLKINLGLIIMTNLAIFLAISLPILRGVLQGRKKFKYLGATYITESLTKIIVGVSLVVLGLKVYGAMIGFLMGFIYALIIAFYYNKDILDLKNKKQIKIDVSKKRFIKFLYSMVIVVLVLSLDVLLAKGFFTDELAGKYSVLSMLGKIVFFGTVAIGRVMFPLTTEGFEKKEKTTYLLKKAGLIMGVLCLAAVIVFYFLPELVIRILFGADYISVANSLVWVGIAFSMLSFSNLIILYGLSTNKLNNYYLLTIFFIVQISLLSIFNSSILEFSKALMLSNTIMFLGSLILVKFSKNGKN